MTKPQVTLLLFLAYVGFLFLAPSTLVTLVLSGAGAWQIGAWISQLGEKYGKQPERTDD